MDENQMSADNRVDQLVKKSHQLIANRPMHRMVKISMPFGDTSNQTVKRKRGASEMMSDSASTLPDDFQDNEPPDKRKRISPPSLKSPSTPRQSRKPAKPSTLRLANGISAHHGNDVAQNSVQGPENMVAPADNVDYGKVLRNLTKHDDSQSVPTKPQLDSRRAALREVFVEMKNSIQRLDGRVAECERNEKELEKALETQKSQCHQRVIRQASDIDKATDGIKKLRSRLPSANLEAKLLRTPQQYNVFQQALLLSQQSGTDASYDAAPGPLRRNSTMTGAQHGSVTKPAETPTSGVDIGHLEERMEVTKKELTEIKTRLDAEAKDRESLDKKMETSMKASNTNIDQQAMTLERKAEKVAFEDAMKRQKEQQIEIDELKSTVKNYEGQLKAQEHRIDALEKSMDERIQSKIQEALMKILPGGPGPKEEDDADKKGGAQEADLPNDSGFVSTGASSATGPNTPPVATALAQQVEGKLGDSEGLNASSDEARKLFRSSASSYASGHGADRTVAASPFARTTTTAAPSFGKPSLAPQTNVVSAPSVQTAPAPIFNPSSTIDVDSSASIGEPEPAAMDIDTPAYDGKYIPIKHNEDGTPYEISYDNLKVLVRAAAEDFAGMRMKRAGRPTGWLYVSKLHDLTNRDSYIITHGTLARTSESSDPEFDLCVRLLAGLPEVQLEAARRLRHHWLDNFKARMNRDGGVPNANPEEKQLYCDVWEEAVTMLEESNEFEVKARQFAQGRSQCKFNCLRPGSWEVLFEKRERLGRNAAQSALSSDDAQMDLGNDDMLIEDDGQSDRGAWNPPSAPRAMRPYMRAAHASEQTAPSNPDDSDLDADSMRMDGGNVFEQSKKRKRDFEDLSTDPFLKRQAREPNAFDVPRDTRALPAGPMRGVEENGVKLDDIASFVDTVNTWSPRNAPETPIWASPQRKYDPNHNLGFNAGGRGSFPVFNDGTSTGVDRDPYKAEREANGNRKEQRDATLRENNRIKDSGNQYGNANLPGRRDKQPYADDDDAINPSPVPKWRFQ